MNRTAFLLLMTAALAASQDADRITVPFSNPGGPKTVRVESMNGNITVRSHAGNEVIVDSRSAGRRPRRVPREMEGLKRIDIAGRELVAEERENTVSISARGPHGDEDMTLLVPAAVTLRVKTLNGDITVDGIQGNLEINSMSGEVKATNIEGSLIAHSLNGDVTVVLNRHDGKPMSFSTLNGTIDATLPADIKARFKIKADHGEVYSDFDMNLEPTASKVEQGDPKSGRYRVKVERIVYANVNGGGPEIAFTTLNGEIKIRRRK